MPPGGDTRRLRRPGGAGSDHFRSAQIQDSDDEGWGQPPAAADDAFAGARYADAAREYGAASASYAQAMTESATQLDAKMAALRL